MTPIIRLRAELDAAQRATYDSPDRTKEPAAAMNQARAGFSWLGSRIGADHGEHNRLDGERRDPT